MNACVERAQFTSMLVWCSSTVVSAVTGVRRGCVVGAVWSDVQEEIDHTSGLGPVQACSRAYGARPVLWSGGSGNGRCGQSIHGVLFLLECTRTDLTLVSRVGGEQAGITPVPSARVSHTSRASLVSGGAVTIAVCRTAVVVLREEHADILSQQHERKNKGKR